MTSALLRVRVAVATFVAVGCLLGSVAAAAQANDAASVLFALDAGKGSLVPVKGKAGTFTLELRNVNARALAFDDRPGRHVGTIRVEKMIDELFVTGQAPPNAAINADVRGKSQELMGVQLRSPRYSPRTHTIQFRVRKLVQEPGSAHNSRADTVLPRHLGHTALFIDNCCGPGATSATVFNSSVLDMVVQVNNGPQFVIAGTGPGSSWTPQQPTYGGPAWNQTGPPAPNVFAPGVNYVTVTPSGSIQPYTIAVTIPGNVEFTSLQLYVFLNPEGTLAWTLTNNGSYVAGNVSSGTEFGP